MVACAVFQYRDKRRATKRFATASRAERRLPRLRAMICRTLAPDWANCPFAPSSATASTMCWANRRLLQGPAGK
eukprot:9184364-Lingulodinium_polyedra.AAC.1